MHSSTRSEGSTAQATTSTSRHCPQHRPYFPADHPLTLSLYNPQGRLVREGAHQLKTGSHSTTSTEPSAPTGTWQAVLDIVTGTFPMISAPKPLSPTASE